MAQQARQVHGSRLVRLALIESAVLGVRLIWGWTLPDGSLRLFGSLLLDAALIVLMVQIYRESRKLWKFAAIQSRWLAAGTLDSRHLGTAVAGAGGLASGMLLAGAGPATVAVTALVGGIFFGLMGLRVVPAWQDPAHGPKIGGLMFCALGVAFFGGAMIIRLTG